MGKQPAYDLNQHLEDMMQRYGVKQTGEEHHDFILKEITKLLEKSCKGKKVSIRGCGVHTNELLDIMPFPYKIDAFYDQKVMDGDGKYERDGKLYAVLPAEKIAKAETDIVIISSFRHRKTIRDELKRICPKIPVIDIYDELNHAGINLQEPFYYNTQRSYDNVLLYRKKYKGNADDEIKAGYLQNLIYYSLKIRDFINALSYLEIYINKGYGNSVSFGLFKEELELFLRKIKERIQSRADRDIIVVWNDQVGFEDLDDFPFLKQASEEGVCFHNAFTPVPFTYAALWGMFEKQYSIDDKVYFVEHEKIGADNRIIHMLKEKGYTFRFIGDGPTSECFDEEYRLGYPSYDSSCVRCFDMLQELINADTKMCIVLQALVETHNPYLSARLDQAAWFEWPYVDVKIGDVKEQIQCSAQYWNEQLEFYLSFTNDKCSKILMSDHGKRYFAEPIYHDLANHVLFILLDDRLEGKQEEKLFTLTRLEEALDYLSDPVLRAEKYESMFSSSIKMQEVGIFNETAIRYYLAEKQYESFIPYRAARGETDKYILLSNGKELYYRLPDEEKNEIDNPRYQSRIEELKETAGTDFVDYERFETELKRFRDQYETH